MHTFIPSIKSNHNYWCDIVYTTDKTLYNLHPVIDKEEQGTEPPMPPLMHFDV